MKNTRASQSIQTGATLWDSMSPASDVAVCERNGLPLIPLERVLSYELLNAIRTAYFAEAAELAVRYGVDVEEVIEHLQQAGLARMPRPERALEHMKCVVHATALTKGVAQAWADLLTVLGPGFDRACAARLNAIDGIAFARRFWIDLRSSSLCGQTQVSACKRPKAAVRRPRGVRAPDLKTFAATRPLRFWLAERLLGSLEVELGRAASASERLDTVQEVRTLRLPAQMAAGAETRLSE